MYHPVEDNAVRCSHRCFSKCHSRRNFNLIIKVNGSRPRSTHRILRQVLTSVAPTKSPRRQPKHPILLCRTSAVINLPSCLSTLHSRDKPKPQGPATRKPQHKITCQKSGITLSMLFIPTFLPPLLPSISSTYHIITPSKCRINGKDNYINLTVIKSSRILPNQHQRKSCTSELVRLQQQKLAQAIVVPGLQANGDRGLRTKRTL